MLSEISAMPRATVILHEPEHRRRSIALQPSDPLAAPSYEHNARAYFEFLREEAGRSDFEFRTDPTDAKGLVRLEGSHNEKIAAHRWLNEQPDIWNWIPAVGPGGKTAPWI